MKSIAKLAFAILSLCLILGSGSFFAQTVAMPAGKHGCERRAFEVNDFGKEGPINYAKQDLANYVEKIKKRQGVSKVRVTHKKPTCRLYLWLGPASEYTCRIEATMCW